MPCALKINYTNVGEWTYLTLSLIVVVGVVDIVARTKCPSCDVNFIRELSDAENDAND